MHDPEPSDADRYPTLSEHGRAVLEFLREHPHAPRYRNQSGNRLTAADLEAVRAFEREVAGARVEQPAAGEPPWLDAFVERCFEDVPYYRALGSRPREFTDIPTSDRSDLSRDITQFVPDSVAIDRLVNYRTSGTTGHTLLLASHPIVAASYLAFHKRALRRSGIELRAGRGQVGVVLLGYQRECFTYVSVTPSMNESGLAKINLHPNDWRAASDREKYLDALAPEVIAGDPLSFSELLRVPTSCRPRALLCTSMALSSGLAEQLRARFECPVVDLYSMNETGPIGVHDAASGGHVLLQHRLFIEILDSNGQRQPPGSRGEITLTGGFNFCLPLLRYRTNDQAALAFDAAGEPVLVGLEGRPPVRFRNTRGEWLNNIDVTHRLKRYALAQYALHQDARGALLFRYAAAGADTQSVRQALLELFGATQELDMQPLPDAVGKVVQYTSELDAP